MSESSTSITEIISYIIALGSLFLASVVGIIVDRKKFRYQNKSKAKTELLAIIYEVISGFPALEEAMRNNTLNEDQFGHWRHYATLIKKANSNVNALGVESNSSSEDIQKLITRIDVNGNWLYNCKELPDEEELNAIANEGKRMMSDAKKLVDKLHSEFQKKKYLIF